MKEKKIMKRQCPIAFGLSRKTEFSNFRFGVIPVKFTLHSFKPSQ
ncbi:hypothetical protein ISN44_As02g010830 [Arabidopsis suecica]|uniref:Uncharacterized protein n=1 Tax=Arabidopsis suecica TaxID=45249 RepID=A0A8T2FXE4_ARASU|nr:hypothetical protein ISN44_As02g010830 [Arabidopsis suecica]